MEQWQALVNGAHKLKSVHLTSSANSGTTLPENYRQIVPGMSEPFVFISAVFNNWFTLVGAVAIVAAVIQYFRKKPLQPVVWVVIGMGCLFWASYQAWLDQHASYLAERCKIEKFEKRSTAKNQLASFMEEATKLLNSTLTKDSPPDQVDSWFHETEDWGHRVYEWVKDNLGPAAATKALDLGAASTLVWSNNISPRHNNVLNGLNKVKENLNSLMEVISVG